MRFICSAFLLVQLFHFISCERLATAEWKESCYRPRRDIFIRAVLENWYDANSGAAKAVGTRLIRYFYFSFV